MACMLLAAALLGVLPATGGDWPQFRGPAGAGVATGDARLPVAFGPEENVLWKTPVPRGDSSPCVAGERVFLTGHAPREDGGHDLVTLCIDRASGAERWRRAVQVDRLERTHDTHGPASPTPACDGERVFASFGSFGLLAYDLDGEELWRRALPAQKNTFGSASSPIVAGGKLIVLRDANDASWLEVLEPATGETTWRVEREGFGSGWSTPAVWRNGDVDELLVYGVGRLVAYDLAGGAVRWSVPGLTDEPIVMPVTGAGLVFVTSYNMKTNAEVIGLPTYAELLERYDADGDGRLSRAEAAENASVLSRFDADGEGDHPLRIFFRMLDGDGSDTIDADEYPKLEAWVAGFSHADGLLAIRPGAPERPAEIAWTHARGVPECPSPLFHDGRVYMVKNGGVATCVDARTGALRYEDRLDARGPCYASPVAGDGKLYAASARGQVTVFAAGDELRVLARNDLGERITATPALVEGAVIVRTQDHLWAFSQRE